MSRDIDSQARPEPERVASVDSREPETLSRERQTHLSRTYAYCLSEAELETLREVGRFRTIDARDLARYRYGFSPDQMQEDLRSLQQQGLLRRREIWTGGHGERLTVLVLTKRAKTFLEQEGRLGPNQKIFAGFVKPAEVHHDAAIYRMYQAEAAKIEHSGGRIRRVVLDYELKQKVYAPLARARAKTTPKSPEYVRRQAEIAHQNGLKVVGGKILLPDLRIEYETAAGESTQVDLELATHHYRGASIRAKAEAGFKLYAPGNSAAGLTSAFDPGLVHEIFSF